MKKVLSILSLLLLMSGTSFADEDIANFIAQKYCSTVTAEVAVEIAVPEEAAVFRSKALELEDENDDWYEDGEDDWYEDEDY